MERGASEYLLSAHIKFSVLQPSHRRHIIFSLQFKGEPSATWLLTHKGMDHCQRLLVCYLPQFNGFIDTIFPHTFNYARLMFLWWVPLACGIYIFMRHILFLSCTNHLEKIVFGPTLAGSQTLIDLTVQQQL